LDPERSVGDDAGGDRRERANGDDAGGDRRERVDGDDAILEGCVVELGFENSAFAALRACAPGPRGGSESPRGVSAV
jgi:hypothetical protein